MSVVLRVRSPTFETDELFCLDIFPDWMSQPALSSQHPGLRPDVTYRITNKWLSLKCLYLLPRKLPWKAGPVPGTQGLLPEHLPIRAQDMVGNAHAVSSIGWEAG